jgi:hypothetical protein
MNLLMHPKFLLVAFATTTIASTTEATGVPTSFAVARRYDPVVSCRVVSGADCGARMVVL